MTEMMNVGVKDPKVRHRFHNESDSSSAGVVQLKAEGGRTGIFFFLFFFNIWDERGKSLMMSLFDYFPSLCEIVGMFLISGHRTVHVNS